MKVKNDHRSKFCNLSKWKEKKTLCSNDVVTFHRGKKLKLFNVTTIDVKRYNHSLHQNTGKSHLKLQR